jgi:hypothetical protein
MYFRASSSSSRTSSSNWYGSRRRRSEAIARAESSRRRGSHRSSTGVVSAVRRASEAEETTTADVDARPGTTVRAVIATRTAAAVKVLEKTSTTSASLARWAVGSGGTCRLEAGTVETATLGSCNDAIGVGVEADLSSGAGTDAAAAGDGSGARGGRSPWRSTALGLNSLGEACLLGLRNTWNDRWSNGNAWCWVGDRLWRWRRWWNLRRRRRRTRWWAHWLRRSVDGSWWAGDWLWRR